MEAHISKAPVRTPNNLLLGSELGRQKVVPNGLDVLRGNIHIVEVLKAI